MNNPKKIVQMLIESPARARSNKSVEPDTEYEAELFSGYTAKFPTKKQAVEWATKRLGAKRLFSCSDRYGDLCFYVKSKDRDMDNDMDCPDATVREVIKDGLE